ncbi:MAG: hypothetical protein EBE86_035235 [Hormoscilla sp. GUM202]|nr:hypothetical protein [Hormoscilla sp. GUM202]
MELFSQCCLCCGSKEVHPHHHYETQYNGSRTIYDYKACDIYYSETFATLLAGLRTPLSRIIQVLKASEGMGLNAVARTFNVSKKSLGDLQPVLMLYALLHQFIIEGDQLYCIGG